MRSFKAFCATLAVLAVFVGALAIPAAFAQGRPAPGDDFIKLVDAKQYGESWDIASAYLKQSVSRSDWAAQVGQAREPLGSVVARKLKSSEAQKDPRGAPPGDYLLLTFETTFSASTTPRAETLPLIHGADGRWRAVGYFIR